MKHLAKLNWIITLLWILGCAGRSETLGPEKPAENKGPGNMATTVTVFLAEYKPFEYHIMTEGKILSERQVEVVSKTSGLVLSVKKQNSSRINQGKVLVFLDSAKQALELERARTNYREKLTEYQSLLMGYTLPGEALKENLRYSSGLAGAEITLKGARMDMANTRITSPINGRVANLDVQRGQTINAGEKLCLVYDPTRMIVVCAVPEYDAGRFKAGQQARVSPVSLEKHIAAVVYEINPLVDVKSGMVRIGLRIPAPQGLWPGMNAGVNITISGRESIVVPREAIVIRSGRKVVFTVEGLLAKWKYVETGLENSKEVEIVEGLQIGDSVIVSNNLQLAHDAKVEVALLIL